MIFHMAGIFLMLFFRKALEGALPGFSIFRIVPGKADMRDPTFSPLIARKASAMAKLNMAQVEKALDMTSEWFPEDAGIIRSNRASIIDHLVNDKTPEADSPLRLIKTARPAVSESYALPSLTPCEEACGVAALDAMNFAFGLLGLHLSDPQRLHRALLRELGADNLRGLSRDIHKLATADDAWGKARALFAVMEGIWTAGGFRAALGVAKDRMPWWDGTKNGVLASAQLTAWFAGNGEAFIAEAALTVMAEEQLIESSAKVGHLCGIP